MKKYIIYSPHKCGSTIINNILTDIFNLPERLTMSQEKTITNDSGEAILQFERSIRLRKRESSIDFIKDDVIFIPRNPIGITMSMFYSFGYTHQCPPYEVKDHFEAVQEDIQNTGLSKYIDNNIKRQSTKIEKCWNWPMNSKTILPYELMISNFNKFLKELLQTLDMVSVYDDTLTRWESSFAVIEDKSDRIVSGESKSHKRTTDINEWKNKLNNETRTMLIEKYPFIQQYDDFLNNLL